jgi:hypothetical protein
LTQALNAMEVLTVSNTVGDGVSGLFDDGRTSATLADLLNKLYFTADVGASRTITPQVSFHEENVIELDIVIDRTGNGGTSSSTITVTFAGNPKGGAPTLADDTVAIFLGT